VDESVSVGVQGVPLGGKEGLMKVLERLKGVPPRLIIKYLEARRKMLLEYGIGA
jgi:hypothetical protein